MTKLGELVEVKDLRTVWPNEAADFTPWLAKEKNIARLGDTIGVEITDVETESGVGAFSVDIFATEDGTGRRIIIENQLEDTNHDHLGKLITYAAGKDASIIIWIVKNAREEHRAAIEWLNSRTTKDVSFFLCEIKLYKIGDSAPAVKFDVVEKPNDWAKNAQQNDTVTKTKSLRYEYWAAFNDYAFRDVAFAKAFNQRKPTYDHWMDFSIGSTEYHLSVSQVRAKKKLIAEFHISDSKDIFHSLLQHKDEIESETGMTFDWRELPDKKASRVLVEKPVDFDDQKQMESQFRWIMDTLLKMKPAFKKFV